MSSISKNNSSDYIKMFFAMIISLLGVYLLSTQFPYSGDDWAWGSEIGLNRLSSRFENYNGRYLGNFLVLALTRSVVARNITISVIIVGIFFLIYKYVNSSISFFLFGMAMFISMPRYLFRQSITWCSGFTNYVPSILISLIFLVVVKNIFEKEKPIYKISTAIFLFFAGIAGSLFIEHITLYNIAISVLVIIYTFLKFKKVFLAHISFAVGSILGAVIMFTNSSYGIIASGNDGYRTMSSGIKGVIRQVVQNCKIIYKEMVFNNIILNIFVLASMILLVYSFLNKKKSKIKIALSVIFLSITVIYVIYTILLTVYPYWVPVLGVPRLMDKVNFVLTGLYLISVFMLVLICVNKEKIVKIILPLISVAIMVVPLLVVTPIGSRCFFPTYVMMVLFVAEIFNYATEEKNDIRFRVFGVVCCSLILVSGTYYGCLYKTIHSYDVRRIEYINQQIELGKEEIEVPYLPYPDYTWNANPENDESIWSYRMKKFYGFDENLKFRFVKYSALDSKK